MHNNSSPRGSAADMFIKEIQTLTTAAITLEVSELAREQANLLFSSLLSVQWSREAWPHCPGHGYRPC